MAKQDPHADAKSRRSAGPTRKLLTASGANQLVTVITQLLPAVNDAVAAHRMDGCPGCVPAGSRDCPMLGLIISVLDLVIWCWRVGRGKKDELDGRASRDLRTAVLSRWLTGAESASLVEILEVLDLAVTQADDVGVNLPALAGIGVAVIDGYRDVTAGTAIAGEVGAR